MGRRHEPVNHGNHLARAAKSHIYLTSLKNRPSLELSDVNDGEAPHIGYISLDIGKDPLRESRFATESGVRISKTKANHP